MGTRRRLGRTLLIFIPLLIFAARLHGGKVGTPSSVTQEVARCLNMVRVAATRRNGRGGPATPRQHASVQGSTGASPGR